MLDLTEIFEFETRFQVADFVDPVANFISDILPVVIHKIQSSLPKSSGVVREKSI
jgi:hypothetical protein